MATDFVTQLKICNDTNNYFTSYSYSNNNIILNNTAISKFEPIPEKDIIDATAKVKNGSSPGIDKISSELLKKNIIILCTHF